jgi:DNA invertase Pin-like site-specific DNA recombinase
MSKRVALYLRVSTTEQTVENQQRELEAVADRHGWNVVAIFTDAGISGTKGRDKRPGYDRLCRGITRRERAMIVERVKAGLSRARAQGERLGRRPVCAEVVERIRESLATGAGILKTAKALGVGTGTVHKVRRSMAAVAV